MIQSAEPKKSQKITITILSKRYNKLFNRDEVNFSIDHSKTGKTPTRLIIKEAIAQKIKINPENVLVKKAVTKTGTQITIGSANVYQSINEMKNVEPEYLINRTTSSEKIEKEE
jgi:ribosomal protein S24E